MSKELPQQFEPLAPETAFQLLGHSTRLGLLKCLNEYDEALALADVAEEIVCTLEDKPVQEIKAESVKRIYMSLYHSHIPRLEAHDMVHYNQERDLVALTERGHQLAEYVDRFKELY